MASPRTYNIYIRAGKGDSLEWSYFNEASSDYWNPVTETSPNLLLKQKDVVNWIASTGIDSLDIILPTNPTVLDPINGNNGKSPNSKGRSTMQAKSLDKYFITAKIGNRSITVDPKVGGDNPPS